MSLSSDSRMASVSYENSTSPARTMSPSATRTSSTVLSGSRFSSAVAPDTTLPANTSAVPTAPVPVIRPTDMTDTASPLPPLPPQPHKSPSAAAHRAMMDTIRFILTSQRKLCRCLLDAPHSKMFPNQPEKPCQLNKPCRPEIILCVLKLLIHIGYTRIRVLSSAYAQGRVTSPFSNSFCTAMRMPVFAWYQVSPP